MVATAAELSIPLWCDCNCICITEPVKLEDLSIPLWCDCNRQAGGSLPHPPSSFNPTMVRLQPTEYDVIEKKVDAFNPTMVRLQQR